MALPVLNAPTHELTLTSSGETIQYRPFLVKEEKNFVDTITKKYGDGQLNIDTGTFTPKETKKEDSKENK